MGGWHACTAELWGAAGLGCWAFRVTATWPQARYLVPAEIIHSMCCACCACYASAQALTARRGTPGRWTAATRCPTVSLVERLRLGCRRVRVPSLNVRQSLVSSAAPRSSAACRPSPADDGVHRGWPGGHRMPLREGLQLSVLHTASLAGSGMRGCLHCPTCHCPPPVWRRGHQLCTTRSACRSAPIWWRNEMHASASAPLVSTCFIAFRHCCCLCCYCCCCLVRALPLHVCVR